MLSREELLARAKRPAEDAMRLHPFYKGKIQVLPKCAVRALADFAIWYTPGVAAPCQAIQRQPELVYDYTNPGVSGAIAWLRLRSLEVNEAQHYSSRNVLS